MIPTSRGLFISLPKPVLGGAQPCLGVVVCGGEVIDMGCFRCLGRLVVCHNLMSDFCFREVTLCIDILFVAIPVEMFSVTIARFFMLFVMEKV